MKNNHLFSILLLAVLLASCSGSKTYVTSSWAESSFTPQNQGTVLILSMTENAQGRAAIESGVAGQLNRYGYNTIQSYEELGPKWPPTRDTAALKEIIRELANDRGVDAIYTVALKKKDSETHYVPPSTSYVPSTPYYGGYGYYGYWYNYYPMTYREVYEPGYYVQSEAYFLETNIYSTNQGQLIWSAQSATTNPTSLKQFTADYTKAIFKQLKKDFK